MPRYGAMVGRKMFYAEDKKKLEKIVDSEQAELDKKAAEREKAAAKTPKGK